MKRLACLFCVLCFCFFITHVSAQKNAGLMKWQEKPVVVDGDISEFTDLPRFCDAGSNLFYEFRNDRENIYFIFYSTNRLTNIKILNSGISISMDTVKLKKNCKNIITMRPPRGNKKMSRPENDIPASEPRENSKFLDTHADVREVVVPDITVSGFYESESGAENISACFYMKRDSLLKGEVVIPVSMLFSGNYDKDPDSWILNFRIQLNELEAPPGISGNGPGKMEMSSNSEGMDDMQPGNVGSGGMDRGNAGSPMGGGMRPPEGGMRPPDGGDSNGPPDFQKNENANYEAVKISGKLKLMKGNE